MAGPHVAGAAALLLQRDSALTPEDVVGQLKARATSGAISNVNPGSPNLLLYTGEYITTTTATATTTTEATATFTTETMSASKASLGTSAVCTAFVVKAVCWAYLF